MSMRNILFLFMVCLFVSSFSLDVSARKRKKEVADTTKSKKEKLSKYDQFFKEREKAGYKVDGVIGQFVSGRELYYIFPVKLLGAKMLLGSTIESVSDNGEALVGEKPYNPMLICFTLAGDKIQIRQDRSYSSSDDPNIQRAIQNSNVETILMEVPLIAYNNDSFVGRGRYSRVKCYFPVCLEFVLREYHPHGRGGTGSVLFHECQGI